LKEKDREGKQINRVVCKLQYILIIGNVEVNPGSELDNHSSVSDNSISICNINIPQCAE
jgi:hypothetical protein